jgi:hypothetical protein
MARERRDRAWTTDLFSRVPMSAGLAFTSNPIVAQKSRSHRSTPRSVIASASSV